MSNEDSAETLAALEAAKAKYAEERAKRLRADGADQWQDFSGEYKDFDRDPYVEPGFTRDALTEEVEVVIVGAGFGGMLAAAQLRQQGITNFRIIDKAGAWYSYGTQRIGQGRENAKMFLKDNPILMAEIEEKVKVLLGVKEAAAPGAPEETEE
jgi:hypothetical protein